MSNRLTAISKIDSSLAVRSAAAASAKKTSKPSSKASIMLPQLLTTEDVAGLLGIAPATLVWWRGQKQGPSWIRLGRGRRSPIRYRLEAVGEYLAQMESAAL